MFGDISTRSLTGQLLAFSLLFAACGADTGGTGDGATDGAGSDHGSVGATTGAGAGGPGGGCFQAFAGSWSLEMTGGASQCTGFAPVEVDVEQQGCTVTIASSHLGGSASLPIDENGKTGSSTFPIGDGVSATCHAEFSQQTGTSVGDVFSMTLSCSAMGISCEFGESKVFTD